MITPLHNEHLPTLYPIWQESLGRQWPLSEAAFCEELRGKTVFQGEQDGAVVGFIAVDHLTGSKNLAIHSLAVLPAYQRHGMGSALLRKASAEFSAAGIETLSAASGGGSYFWPGIPTNLPAGLAFFAKAGFEFYESSYDLTLDLDSYAPAKQAPPPPGVRLHLSDESGAEKIVAFEQVHFPDWRQYFQYEIDARNFPAILLASDTATGEILGTVLLFGPDEHKWSRLLPTPVGGLGALGVHPGHRERGIGLALAAAATAQLKDRGVKTSFVGWTWLVEWYGRLGYTVFQEYKMARRPQLS